MISGFDRYYQIVKCFRDEDLRADRQPEFTQIDCEMSFVNQELILQTFETFMINVVNGFYGKEVVSKFPRMTFAEAMERYGCDKPDTRFGLELCNLSDLVKGSQFAVFKNAVTSGGIVNAITVKKAAADFSRKKIDELTEFVKPHGLKGLAWAKVQADYKWQSPIAKFFSEAELKEICEKLSAEEGDLILFGAGPYEDTTKAGLSALRNHLGAELKLYNPEQLNFLWIIDFPLMEKDEESGKLMARHHPFCMPAAKDLDNLEANAETALAEAYDLVCNGFEIGGGSVRNHIPELQEKIFKLIGLDQQQAEDKFGFLLQASN